jgi:hypothetical protein
MYYCKTRIKALGNTVVRVYVFGGTAGGYFIFPVFLKHSPSVSGPYCLKSTFIQIIAIEKIN